MRYERLAFLILILTFLLSGLTLAQNETTFLVLWGQPEIVNCINEINSNPACEYARWIDAAFEAAYPDIRLNWQDRGSGELLYLNLADETIADKPDIIVSDLFIPALAAAGYLEPVDLSQSTLNNFIPVMLPTMTYENEVYGVLANTNLFTLEVNPGLITKSGLDIESIDFTQWQTVIETAAIVTENSGGSYGFAVVGASELPSTTLSYAAPFIYNSGVLLCNETCTQPLFNGEEAVRGYSWIHSLYHQSPSELVFSGDISHILAQITTDYTAMQIAPTTRIAKLGNTACRNCTYYPLPQVFENIPAANSLVNSAVYAITKSSTNKEAAAIFLQWLTGDEVQLASFWYGRHLPVTSSALNKLMDVSNSDLSSVPVDFTDDAAELVRVYNSYLELLLAGRVASPPLWQSNALELNTLWNEMFVDILNAEVSTIGAILNDYQERAVAIVGP